MRAGYFCSCNRAPSAGETHSLACVWRNRPTVDDFTVEQVEQAIEHAMSERNFEVVVALLKIMAVKDPDRADAILATIKVGLAIAAHQPDVDTDQ